MRCVRYTAVYPPEPILNPLGQFDRISMASDDWGTNKIGGKLEFCLFSSADEGILRKLDDDECAMALIIFFTLNSAKTEIVFDPNEPTAP